MPKSGSQVLLCDLPVRFDTYKGCSHGCVYCFAQKKANMSDIKPYESVFVLKNFIEGKLHDDPDAECDHHSHEHEEHEGSCHGCGGHSCH